MVTAVASVVAPVHAFDLYRELNAALPSLFDSRRKSFWLLAQSEASKRGTIDHNKYPVLPVYYYALYGMLIESPEASFSALRNDPWATPGLRYETDKGRGGGE